MNHYLKLAEELHRQVPVTDAHNDLAGELLIRHRHGETNVIRRLYLDHWKAAGFQLIVSSVYIENSVFFPENWRHLVPESAASSIHDSWKALWKKHALRWNQGYENALDQIRVLKQEIADAPEELCLVTSGKDLDAVREHHKIGILLYMEGLDCIGNHPDRIHTLYQSGVRGAGLTWSRQNLLATGCCSATQFTDIRGRITPLGQQVIKELIRHHMFLDISHLNNDGFDQLVHLLPEMDATLPMIATQSNAWTIHPNYRNLTDEQLLILAEQGGITGLNACKYIAGSYEESPIDALCRQIEYIQSVTGASHIGLGFDLCDSYSRAKYAPVIPEPEDNLRNHKEALLLTARLLERGMSEQTVLRLLGLNWIQYFEQVLQ